MFDEIATAINTENEFILENLLCTPLNELWDMLDGCADSERQHKLWKIN